MCNVKKKNLNFQLLSSGVRINFNSKIFKQPSKPLVEFSALIKHGTSRTYPKYTAYLRLHPRKPSVTLFFLVAYRHIISNYVAPPPINHAQSPRKMEPRNRFNTLADAAECCNYTIINNDSTSSFRLETVFINLRNGMILRKTRRRRVR